MQLARTAATLKGQFLPVLFCRGERGGERERENHGNNKWVLMIFHGQQNVGLQFNIHQFEKLMQRLKSKESQSLHKSIHCNLEHFHLLNQGSINHINTQTRQINH